MSVISHRFTGLIRAKIPVLVASTSRCFATEAPAGSFTQESPSTTSNEGPSASSEAAVTPAQPKALAKDPLLVGKRVMPAKRPLRVRPENPGYGGRIPRAPIAEYAQKVYLPNFTLTLVRNSPAHANDPYTATFRVPTQLTKPDIVTFLTQAYGLNVLGIRTSIKMGRVYHHQALDQGFKRFTRQKTIKTAFIQMDRPFWYPEAPKQEWLNENFEVSVFLFSARVV